MDGDQTDLLRLTNNDILNGILVWTVVAAGLCIPGTMAIQKYLNECRWTRPRPG